MGKNWMVLVNIAMENFYGDGIDSSRNVSGIDSIENVLIASLNRPIYEEKRNIVQIYRNRHQNDEFLTRLGVIPFYFV